MTPETVQQLFNSWSVVIMMLWGVACKYLPVLVKIPNASIGWVNLVGYILVQFAVPKAHAGIDSPINNTIGIILAGSVNSGLAMVLYETLLRHLFGWVGLKKAAVKS